MDDDEYDLLRWAEIDAQVAEHAKYQRSIPGKVEWLLRDLAEQTLALELSSEALERALERRRHDIAEKWNRESIEKKEEILRRAREAQLPGTESFEGFWRQLGHPDSCEKSIQRELYDEWITFEHYFDQEHRAELSDDTDSLLRFGGIISAHAILETRLEELCALLRDHRKVALSLDDLAKRGSELERARRFLDKVLGIQTPDKIWRDLEVFVEIRHCIAHRLGMDDRSKRLLPKHRDAIGPAGVADVKNGKLVLTGSTVVQFSRAIHALFEGIAAEVRQWSTLRLAASKV